VIRKSCLSCSPSRRDLLSISCLSAMMSGKKTPCEGAPSRARPDRRDQSDEAQHRTTELSASTWLAGERAAFCLPCLRQVANVSARLARRQFLRTGCLAALGAGLVSCAGVQRTWPAAAIVGGAGAASPKGSARRGRGQSLPQSALVGESRRSAQTAPPCS
jgi:hypothetical protein